MYKKITVFVKSEKSTFLFFDILVIVSSLPKSLGIYNESLNGHTIKVFSYSYSYS